MRTTFSFPTGCFGLLLIVIGPVTPSAADDAQQYTLRYQFEAGQSVSYTVDNQSHVHLQKGQAEQHVEHGSVTDKRYTVRAVDADGNAELELQIDRVRMSAGVDGADAVTFDSDSGEVPPATLQGIAETVGKPHVRVKVSPTGHLLSIDWLVGKKNQRKPTTEDEASLDILVVLPSEPLSVGQTWKQPFEIQVTAAANLTRKIKLQREYTLKTVDGDRATITLKTSVLTPLHDPEQEYQLIAKLFNGTIGFDLGRGIVVSRTLNVDRVVVGFEGPNSKIHNVSTRTEKLVQRQIAAEATGDAVRK